MNPEIARVVLVATGDGIFSNLSLTGFTYINLDYVPVTLVIRYINFV